MRALVTGGTGFIGGALVRDLIENGHEVVIVDSMYDPFIRLGLGLEENRMAAVELHAMDVADIADKDFGKIDIVYHIAAHYANVRSLKEPQVCMHSNMAGTMAVLEFCKKNEVKKMMYASSSGVYGAMDVVAYAESSQPRPSTPYEVTKYAGELLCSGYCEIHDISLVAPRFFNVYGPGDLDGEFRAVIPKFFRCALAGEPLVITGQDSSRDFTFIDDVVAAVQSGVARIDEAPSRIELIYNIGTGQETFVKNLAQMIIDQTKSSSKIEETDRRYWDNAPRRVGDVHKFRALFPKEAEDMRHIDKGLEDSLNWYKHTCGGK